MPKSSFRDLRNDKRGAVLVEFAIAFMPLMITFSAFVQLQQLAAARLVTKHSAIVGARAASVISNAARNTPDQKDDDNVDEIKAGVEAALGPWRTAMTNVTVQVDDTSSCSDPFGMVSVTVTTEYKCSVPFSNLFVCGTGRTHVFKPMTARFPHQGARYQDGGGATRCSKKQGDGTFSGKGGQGGGAGASGRY